VSRLCFLLEKGITGRTILAEVYSEFTEKEAEEFHILLSKLVEIEYLVANDTDVFSADAQATVFLPSSRAFVTPTVILRSLKDRVGFIPSCLA
jgi:hypothetical protein